MGLFLAKIWKKRARDVRILINGLDAAGKTTMLYRLKLGEVVTTIPTIGFNVETVEYKNVNFTAWFISGRHKIRPLWRQYFQNLDAFVFVVDSNDRERMDEARDEMFRYAVNDDTLKNCIFAIVANKQDLPNAASVQEIREKFEVEKIKKTRACEVFPACATSGVGLYDVLNWLSEQIEGKDKSFEPKVAETIEKLKPATDSKMSITHYIKSLFLKL